MAAPTIDTESLETDPIPLSKDVLSTRQETVKIDESLADAEDTEKSIDHTIATTTLISSVDNDQDHSTEAPTIAEQRQIILELSQQPFQERSKLNVIYSSWFDSFQQADFKNYGDARSRLGPLDLRGITNELGVFCDYNRYPLKAVDPVVFDQLVEWYGLVPGSRPVSTFAIETEEGLQPEYSKPFFQLHYLTIDGSSSTSSGFHHSSNYAPIPSFAISSLNTFEDLVQTSIKKLFERKDISASTFGFHEKRFRVWVIDDDNLINLNYQIFPTTFLNLRSKHLITKKHLSYPLKGSGLSDHHLVIEEKYVPKNKKLSESYWPSNYFVHHPPTPSDGRIGLQNLGNTCYMNSALQCLVHIPELTQYFLFDCYEKELNKDNPLGMGGRIASSFAGLIHNLFDKKSNRGTSLVPRDFKQTIGHFNSMFSGYHQQDSQEFLAFLLDGLHEDLNRIIKKPTTEKPELGEKDANNPEAINQLAVDSWRQHTLRNDSIIIDLFVGLYKSTLICPTCSKISITFDPFSDLTLPLPVNNTWNFKLLLFLEEGPIKSFEVQLPKTSTYSTLKSYVANKLKLDRNHLITAEIWNNQYYRNFENTDSQSSYLPISDLISENDVIVMYEVIHKDGDLIVPVLSTVRPDSNIPSAFAIPFFITLDEHERNSYQSIRLKLEHRYEQLSTYKYFSSSRGKDSSSLVDLSNVSGISKDGALGEYGFKVKVFDSTKEVKIRRKANRYNRSSTLLSDHKSSAREEKVWTPNTSNNFTNLPDLFSSKGGGKRSSSSPQTDSNKSNPGLNTISPLTANQSGASLSSDDDPLPGSFKTTNTIAEPNSSLLYEDGDISEDSTTEVNIPESIIVDLEDENPLEENVEPLLNSSQSSTNQAALIQSNTALVCEWGAELFDIFFSGLEDDGQGGNNTWTNPEVLINEEVEELKQKLESEKSKVLTLDECLRLFSRAETLSEQDSWYCSNCKEHRQASKQIQIWSTPDILSIHLKRFENQRSFSDKIDSVVDFPITGLDVSPYLASQIQDDAGSIYDLFAVDNHFGGLGGGHYTSYVKNFVDGKWYYYDDSRVTETTPEKAITGAAYLLFYRRRSSVLGGERISEMLEKAREEYEQSEISELQRLELFYRENKESESEEDEDEDIDQVEAEVADLVNEDENNDSDDDVSIIPVGSDDEDDSSAIRRKIRVISRRPRALRLGDVSAVQSDLDSPAATSPNSSVSDDNCSTYSSTINVPASLYNINSPRRT